MSALRRTRSRAGAPFLAVALLLTTPALARAQDIGAMAPDFAAPLVADTATPWHLWSRAPAHLTVLSFWATWCKPCETLHPWIEAVARNYASRGVRVVTINMREPADSIRRLLAADSGSATIDVLDPDGQITGLYSVTSVPTTLLLAENNIVVRRWEGVNAVMGGLEPVMNRLLPPEPPATGSRPQGCSE